MAPVSSMLALSSRLLRVVDCVDLLLMTLTHSVIISQDLCRLCKVSHDSLIIGHIYSAVVVSCSGLVRYCVRLPSWCLGFGCVYRQRIAS